MKLWEQYIIENDIYLIESKLNIIKRMIQKVSKRSSDIKNKLAEIIAKKKQLYTNKKLLNDPKTQKALILLRKQADKLRATKLENQKKLQQLKQLRINMAKELASI